MYPIAECPVCHARSWELAELHRWFRSIQTVWRYWACSVCGTLMLRSTQQSTEKV